jgi:pyridinium-3,5-bisthiocarboxylic acid mononucleotide nickel chelatase
VHVHLDAVGGMAGDMFIAAILDARPDLAEGTVAAMRAAGLPDAWSVELLEHKGHAITGHRLNIGCEEKDKPHHHVSFAHIHAMIDASSLAAPVRAGAVAVFRLLAEAEGAVHGMDPDHVTFHEVGDWDSVADIVGAAFLIDALGATGWSVSALPLGSGRVKTAHGLLPVPAPATARLLRGFETMDDGISGERVTPTGAAILCHLRPAQGGPRPAARLIVDGSGFGTRELPGIPNMVRALLFEGAAADTATEVAVIAFEVDDQTPEDLAVGLDALRRLDGVIDVLQAPVFGKKGRLVVAVQVLARLEALDTIVDACFTETTTLGVRWHASRRVVLEREMTHMEGVRVKVVTRPGGVRSAKADIDDVREAASGHLERAAAREAAQRRALEDEKE